MNHRAAFLLPILLALVSPALAQPPHVRGMQPGGAGGHLDQVHQGPGQQPHEMTPEMHFQHMMEQFWYEQMMLNEMSSMPRAGRGHARPQQPPGQQQPGNKQPSHGDAPLGDLAHTDSGPPAQSRATGSKELRSDRTGMTNGIRDREKAEDRHHRDRSTSRADRRETAPANKSPLARDHATAELLRTAVTRLRRADTDYAGRRVRAMEYINAALRHLGAPTAVVASLPMGAGPLPQRESDEILRDALGSLNRAEVMLNTGASTAHHQNAQIRRRGDPRA